MNINHALLASQAPALDPQAGIAWAREFGLLCLVVILIYLTGKALLNYGGRGDISKSFSMFTATMICLLPLGLLGGAAVLTGYGSALLSVVTKILAPS